MNSIRFTKTHPSFFPLLFLTLILTLMLSFTAARADDPSAPTGSLSTDILSQYIFRGLANSKGSAVIEPSFTGTWNGFSANVWGNFDTSRHSSNAFLPMGNEEGNSKWSETDFTVSYTKELCKNFSVLIGNVYYGLNSPLGYGPNLNLDEDEVYGGVSYNFPWFTAAFTTYGEVMHSIDEYFELDLSKAIPLPMLDCVCKGTVLNLGASFGYLILNHNVNTLALNGTTGSFSNFDTCFLNANVTFPVNKWLSVSPKIGLWLPLTSDAEDYLQANSLDKKATHFFGGLNLTATF
ncbi:MAG: hypothetical protein P4L55_07530 [Syntrophobacteraceae bacterium]|nr:hypothetical protein [Syntrophobacteraceae bacterium]